MATDPSRVSILLPTLNEAECIGSVLRDIPPEHAPRVLVVDGHSTDGTADVVRGLGFAAVPQEGRGLGRAIATGVEKTDGDIIIVLDTDGSHDPREIPRMVAMIDQGYDLVIGSRYSDGPPEAGMFSRRRRSTSADDTPLHAFGNRLFTWLCRVLFRLPVHDVLMGYKAFRREVFDVVRIDASEQDYDIEVLLRAHKAGFRIGELPMAEHRRIGGVAKLSAFRHGALTLKVILRERLTGGPRVGRSR